MRVPPWSLRLPWGAQAAAAVLWIACFVVFADPCLSQGGAGSAGYSTFDYSESLPVAAIIGVALLIPVIAARWLAARVAIFVAKRKPQAWRSRLSPGADRWLYFADSSAL